MDDKKEMMQFDSTLGGKEKLPNEVHLLKFAAARCKEIAAMTECIMNPCHSKLVFQTLPVHMRRRIMSHNSKRLPRRLRAAYEAQLSKSGQPLKLKRPSRKHRRRPKNLLQEYNRRKRNHVWLETHIWHAKRFYMTEKWGYKLPMSPCDRAFRACYRAGSKHCLLQDVSYYPSIQLAGDIKTLKQGFQKITSPQCGLGITAQAYLSGKRVGNAYVFHIDKYPSKCIGKITFFWQEITNDSKTIWIFMHPSFYGELIKVLIDCFKLKLQKFEDDYETPVKRMKLNENSQNKETIELKHMNNIYKNDDDIILTEMKDCVNRFRLTGPLSHVILSRALTPLNLPSNLTEIESNWFLKYCKSSNNKEVHETQANFWNKFKNLKTPSELPCHLIVGLNVRDPRINYPQKRTKVLPVNKLNINVEDFIQMPKGLSHSYLWNEDVTKMVSSNIKTTLELNKMREKYNLVPGEYCSAFDNVHGVPVILIQRPGCQNYQYKRIGYNSGWDIIVPSGYGMAFWLSLILRGARAGGLRESSKMAYESGVCEVQPDTKASQIDEEERAKVLSDKYFRLPPNKRVNFNKMSVNSAFLCKWTVLSNDWMKSYKNEEFFVMRDRTTLKSLQEMIITKKFDPTINWNSNALIPVKLTSTKKGKLSDFALICLPKSSDSISMKSQDLLEPLQKDKNQKLRHELRTNHKLELTKLRRRRVKLKRKLLERAEKFIEVPKQNNSELNSKYASAMRELWLSSNVEHVRHQCSRETMGYVTHGDYSFTEAKACGLGYIALQSIRSLMEICRGKERLVLTRSTRSRQYRFANIEIITEV